MRRCLYICFLLVLPLAIFSQASPKKTNPRFTLRSSFGIPRVISSQMFRTAFNGVMEGGLSANLRLQGNFFAGLGYDYTSLRNNKEVFVFYRTSTGNNLSYNTGLIGQGLYVKVGYDNYFSEIGYTTIALNGGYMLANYTKINPDTLPSSFPNANLPRVGTAFNAPYIQPEFSINFKAEDAVSFGILLSYTTLFYKFDPKAPRFNQISEIRDSRNRYFMGWINIGLGCHILLGKK